jgi:hypothetical protein
MRSVYELKKFKNSRDPDLVQALKIYTAYTEPALRTDTREIMHWLDKWNVEFDDRFHIVGFYFNNVLIGFSELAYFKQEKFVIVDYFVIDKEFRKNNTFYQFLEEIFIFLDRENYEYSYIIGEVGCYLEKQPPESARLLIRLLKMSHFGVLKCNYYVPRLGLHDYESEMRAVMMIYSRNEVSQIKKETFFQIVNAIYYKYYHRWHIEFVDENEKIRYSRDLHDLILKMEKELSNKKVIEINGLSSLFPVKIESGNKLERKKIVKLITGIVLFAIAFTLIGCAYLLIKSRLGIDSETVSSVFYVSLFVTLFLLALLFENRSNLFSRMIEKLLEKL